MPSEPPYANNLRSLRGAAHLSRPDLARRTAQIASEQPEECRSVTVSALEKLEAGANRPRPATARAIAAALGRTIDEIFPHGTLAADFVPNPTGKSGYVLRKRDLP